MSDAIQLTAEIRTDVGKGASRRLRRAGQQVPAIMYGADEDPQKLTLAVNQLNKAMEQEAFYSQILDVTVNGKATRAVVRDLQRNPSNGKVLHIDFQRIDENKAMNVSVPLHFINEDKCVGVRMEGGIISHLLNEVEISCLPADLPEYIEVDMENIALGYGVNLSGLALPANVTIVALTYGEDHDIPVVNVVAPRAAAVEEEVAEAPEAEEAAGEEDAGEDGNDES